MKGLPLPYPLTAARQRAVPFTLFCWCVVDSLSALWTQDPPHALSIRMCMAGSKVSLDTKTVVEG